jgi:hypothetical protein
VLQELQRRLMMMESSSAGVRRASIMGMVDMRAAAAAATASASASAGAATPSPGVGAGAGGNAPSSVFHGDSAAMETALKRGEREKHMEVLVRRVCFSIFLISMRYLFFSNAHV